MDSYNCPNKRIGCFLATIARHENRSDNGTITFKNEAHIIRLDKGNMVTDKMSVKVVCFFDTRNKINSEAFFKKCIGRFREDTFLLMVNLDKIFGEAITGENYAVLGPDGRFVPDLSFFNVTLSPGDYEHFYPYIMDYLRTRTDILYVPKVAGYNFIQDFQEGAGIYVQVIQNLDTNIGKVLRVWDGTKPKQKASSISPSAVTSQETKFWFHRESLNHIKNDAAKKTAECFGLTECDFCIDILINPEVRENILKECKTGDWLYMKGVSGHHEEEAYYFSIATTEGLEVQLYSNDAVNMISNALVLAIQQKRSYWRHLYKLEPCLQEYLPDDNITKQPNARARKHPGENCKYSDNRPRDSDRRHSATKKRRSLSRSISPTNHYSDKRPSARETPRNNDRREKSVKYDKSGDYGRRYERKQRPRDPRKTPERYTRPRTKSPTISGGSEGELTRREGTVLLVKQCLLDLPEVVDGRNDENATIEAEKSTRDGEETLTHGAELSGGESVEIGNEKADSAIKGIDESTEDSECIRDNSDPQDLVAPESPKVDVPHKSTVVTSENNNTLRSEQTKYDSTDTFPSDLTGLVKQYIQAHKQEVTLLAPIKSNEELVIGFDYRMESPKFLSYKMDFNQISNTMVNRETEMDLINVVKHYLDSKSFYLQNKFFTCKKRGSLVVRVRLMLPSPYKCFGDTKVKIYLKCDVVEDS
uniref:Peptidylprolyl isomerase n=1 Tax=Rhabditophanes sp. KR3021 TaxID=114890 RepID=A0AC35TRM4_9BILA